MEKEDKTRWCYKLKMGTKTLHKDTGIENEDQEFLKNNIDISQHSLLATVSVVRLFTSVYSLRSYPSPRH
jgi:hypothetical protein